MKDLRNMILENHYWKTNDNNGGSLDKDVSVHYWKMRRSVEGKWGQFKKIYEDSLRQQLIDFLTECGKNDKWHTLYINPVPIEFDYNISGGYDKGLVCGFYTDPNDGEPIMMIDCLDGKPLFCLSIDSLMKGRMLRLRNNVLIDDSVLYKIICNGYIAYTIPLEYSKSLRKKEYDRITSDSGKVSDNLRKLFKEKKYKEFEETIKNLVETYGNQNRNGKYIELKRLGRFWDCFIEQISIVNGTTWLMVYLQGDLSDTSEEIKLSDLLKNKKMKLSYKNESFTVDEDSIKDMIEDLEGYLNERK